MATIRVPDDIVVGRVLHEDDAFMTLEIAKDIDRELTLNPDPEHPDQFYTLVFLRPDGEGDAVPWKPWNDAS